MQKRANFLSALFFDVHCCKTLFHNFVSSVTDDDEEVALVADADFLHGGTRLGGGEDAAIEVSDSNLCVNWSVFDKDGAVGGPNSYVIVES